VPEDESPFAITTGGPLEPAPPPMTADRPGILQLLAQANYAIGAVPKADRNAQQGFTFRGIDTIMRHVGPVFAHLGIVPVPEVLESQVEVVNVGSGDRARTWRLVQLRVRYTFWSPAGDCIEAVTTGEGFDPGDKAASKAMSMAYKYALLQVLCISDAEVDEADASSAPDPQPARRSRSAARQPTPPPTVPAQVDPAIVDRVNRLQTAARGVPQAERAGLREAFRAEFGHMSDLTPETIDRAEQWMRDAIVAINATQASEGDQ
jgi:hypothetical protein